MAILRTNSWLLVVILIAGITVKNTPTAFAKFGFGKHPPPPPPPTDGDDAPPPNDHAPAPTSDRVKEKIGDMFDFLKYCGIYMNRFSPRFHRPNEECCTHARKVNIKYFCTIFFIKQTEAIFSPRKVAIIAKDCGKPLRRFTFCGSYMVRHLQNDSIAQESDYKKTNFMQSEI